MKRAFLLVIAMGATAHASPIQLAPDQIAAATKAAQAKLPAVDQAKVDRCKKDHHRAFDAATSGQSAAEFDAAAQCLRAAGALGAAVTMWKVTAKDFADTKEGMDSARQLGAAYEAAGMYADAAQAHADYAATYPKEPDARDKAVRAVCIWEQLGDTDDAAKGLVTLARWKQKVAPATLCDAIRPIQPPKAP